AEELRYINTLVDHPEDPAYERSFKQGLVHAVRMMLLVQSSAEREGPQWKRSFDVREFRKEFDQSLSSFQKSGDLGTDIVRSFDQVRQRIDKDRDGKFSDSEIQEFVAEKIMITQYRMSF